MHPFCAASTHVKWLYGHSQGILQPLGWDASMWDTPRRHPAPGRGCRVGTLDKGPPQLELESHPHLQLVGFRVLLFAYVGLLGLSLFALTLSVWTRVPQWENEFCCVLLLQVRLAHGLTIFIKTCFVFWLNS